MELPIVRSPGTGPPPPGDGPDRQEDATLSGESLTECERRGGQEDHGGKEVQGTASESHAAQEAPTKGIATAHNQGNAAAQLKTWGDRVRSHHPNVEVITEELARKSHMLEGVWNPIQVKKLMNTIMTDWGQDAVVPSQEETQMRTEVR
ncbi:hypothetical protein PRIC1_004243 [Phytophthora ramorum]